MMKVQCGVSIGDNEIALKRPGLPPHRRSVDLMAAFNVLLMHRSPSAAHQHFPTFFFHEDLPIPSRIFTFARTARLAIMVAYSGLIQLCAHHR